jgi:hypothetical protein
LWKQKEAFAAAQRFGKMLHKKTSPKGLENI